MTIICLVVMHVFNQLVVNNAKGKAFADIFSSWVYSSVDERTETILDYSVHGISHDEWESGFTKEDVLQYLKENPEQKQW